MIYPDGLVHKLPQDDPMYTDLMTKIKNAAPTFTPYSDDGDLGLFFDVVGSKGPVRFKVPTTSSTTTTSTTQ